MRFIAQGNKNKGTRYISLLLCGFILCAFLSLPSTVSAVSSGDELLDIKAHWAEQVIRKWVSQGLAKGYGDGRFGPNDSITRAEFVTLLNRIFGYTEKSDKSFPDVKADAWYAGEIAKAYQAGIIGGDNKGNMNPEAVISRQEAVVILTRAFSLTGNHIDAALKYTDVHQIADWALGAVGTMTMKDYVTGRPGNLFAPKASLTRCEAVKMIDNVMGELINASGTYTRVVPGNMVVSSPGVTLKDTYIAGDLYLTEGIGNAPIQLIGVEIKGRTIVADGIDMKSILTPIAQGDTQVQATPTPTNTPVSTTPTTAPGASTPSTPNPTTQPNPTQGPTAVPTPTGTATPTPTPTSTVTPSPTSTVTPTPTKSATPTPTKTATPTPTSKVTPTPTSTATPTPTSTVTPSPTNTVTPTPTKSATPTPTKTATPTPTSTVTPIPTPGQEKVYYIRQGANGVKNGTDWINAWTELPDALERGATYYIAAGTYGSHVFKDPEVGSEFITLKKATVEDHGTDIGWNEAYANGQAIFTADTGPIFTFDSGYYTFDGQTGNGKSGHGIKIYNPNDGTGGGPGTVIRAVKTARFLTFEHTEIEGCNWREDTTPSTRLLYLIGDVSYFTLRYCYVHESSTQWMYCNKSTDILIEHCYFENCSNGMGLKIFGSSDQMNVVIRYNHFENVYNNNNFIQLGEHHCAKSSGYEIYGNVFTMTDPLAKCTIAIGNCSDSANDNVFIYNNTFVGLVGSGLSFDNVNETNIAANNLWVNCSGNSALKNIKDLNNSRNVYSPYIFANPDEGDFRLVMPLKGGTDLGSTYSTDFDGKTRGEDGDWDYGAFEFRTDELPHAFFSYSTITDTLSGHEPFSVNVDASGTIIPDGCSIVSYSWDWGDGTTSSGSTAAHTFSAGRYTITLTVTDNLNRKDTRKLSANVIPSKYPNLYLYLPLNWDCEDASEKGMKASGTVIYEQGVIGQAARFDQDTSRSISVNHSNYLDGFEKITIAFWAKKNSIQSDIPLILKHVVYRIALTANGIRANLWNTQGKSGSAEARNIVTDTGWHHYAMVYDGSAIKVYVDGVSCASAPFTGVIKRDVTKPLVIGRNPWGDSFDGLMDEIRIYDRALTDDEILTLKDSAKQ